VRKAASYSAVQVSDTTMLKNDSTADYPKCPSVSKKRHSIFHSLLIENAGRFFFKVLSLRFKFKEREWRQ